MCVVGQDMQASSLTPVSPVSDWSSPPPALQPRNPFPSFQDVDYRSGPLASLTALKECSRCESAQADLQCLECHFELTPDAVSIIRAGLPWVQGEDVLPLPTVTVSVPRFCQGNGCARAVAAYSPFCYKCSPLAVAPSGLPGAGYGVFAKRDITQGELLCSYTTFTEALEVKSCTRFSVQHPMKYVWQTEFHGLHGLYWDSERTRAVCGLCNSLRPEQVQAGYTFNAMLQEDGELRALASIPMGDEVFWDYGDAYVWGAASGSSGEDSGTDSGSEFTCETCESDSDSGSDSGSGSDWDSGRRSVPAVAAALASGPGAKKKTYADQAARFLLKTNIKALKRVTCCEQECCKNFFKLTATEGGGGRKRIANLRSTLFVKGGNYSTLKGYQQKMLLKCYRAGEFKYTGGGTAFICEHAWMQLYCVTTRRQMRRLKESVLAFASKEGDVDLDARIHFADLLAKLPTTEEDIDTWVEKHGDNDTTRESPEWMACQQWMQEHFESVGDKQPTTENEKSGVCLTEIQLDPQLKKDIYEEYYATQLAQHEFAIASFSLFIKVWKIDFAHVTIRQWKNFSSCSTCTTLRLRMRNAVTMAERNSIKAERHLHYQQQRPGRDWGIILVDKKPRLTRTGC